MKAGRGELFYPHCSIIIIYIVSGFGTGECILRYKAVRDFKVLSMTDDSLPQDEPQKERGAGAL